MKKIAILLCTYNGENYLREQIDSILNQKCDCKIDIFVRDDGSIDNTIEILKDYSDSKKIKLTLGNNIGPAKGFLELLKNNVGYDYYAFSDQDDVWYNNKIQRGIDLINKANTPTLYFSNADLVDNKLNSLGRKVHKNIPCLELESILCVSTTAQGCTSIINSSLAEIIQEKEIPNGIIMHDTYITSICAAIGGDIIFDKYSTMMYRMHSNNDVGFPTKEQQGIFKMINLRYKDIINKRKISMVEQVKTIYELYSKIMSEKNRKICLQVINTKESVFERLKLVLSKKIKYESISMSISYRIKILLGNN